MVRLETLGSSSLLNVHAEANANLDRLLRQPPLIVDCRELMAELGALEKRAPEAKGLLQRGLAKYEYAERAQHASRVKKLQDAIEQLIGDTVGETIVAPLEIDVDALEEALRALGALVPADALLGRGERALAIAHKAQAEALEAKRRLATAEIERCAGVPPLDSRPIIT